ncbi:Lysosome membrane protein 2 [Fragariocoptes setiger]|uniref:Lysosome membrane protein 2 n=1 Tax=Fragariocoptes setiger TaxID=1670756 RepID=A0ABQ7SC03_9ACAR|nr:Lysosome membrane protein 2 [Fragariocoptes setiger]
MWKYICYVVGVLVGTSLIVCGIFGSITMPKLIDEKIRKTLVIVEGSEGYKKFVSSPVPMQAQVYLFNVTNAEELLDYDVKPKLEQVGPFFLTESRRKEIVKFNDKNTTLDYRLYRTYYFEADKSAPLSSVITIPNVAAFTAISSAVEKNKMDENTLATNVLSEKLVNETMYLTDTAENILFKGIRLTWLDALEKDMAMDNGPPNNTFGIFYGKNGTWDKEADGTMTISTGYDGNMTNIGRVLLWNGKTELSTWKGDPCNRIVGTDGTSFHPNIRKEEKLEVFSPDLCRSLAIEFKQITSMKSVELYRYGMAPSFYDPIDSSDETKCYCVKKTPREKKQFCSARGIIDLSSCRRKPIVMSTPHFFNGDDNLRNVFEGLQPSHQEHDTYIDVEPITGYVLRAKRRLQVNVEMLQNEDFTMANTPILQRMGRLIHPFLYIDQSGTITDELLAKLEAKLITKIRLYKILLYSAIVTGAILLTATLIFIMYEVTTTGKKEKKQRAVKGTVGDVAAGEVLLNNLDKDKQQQNASSGLIR